MTSFFAQVISVVAACGMVGLLIEFREYGLAAAIAMFTIVWNIRAAGQEGKK